ncbi:MAG: hypothetical protein FJ399_10180, partial [Verrucomicrobia bacterium]|nr:hypothetical protein [Verrucomicrobiota bacterium]
MNTSRSVILRCVSLLVPCLYLAPALPGAQAEDSRVVLSPFEVTVSAFDTYEATNTNSITGTN